MPKNTACPGVPWVSDPITDQEMAFAHLIHSGTMTDRRAAEAVVSTRIRRLHQIQAPSPRLHD
jgi:hypothetical protein